MCMLLGHCIDTLNTKDSRDGTLRMFRDSFAPRYEKHSVPYARRAKVRRSVELDAGCEPMSGSKRFLEEARQQAPAAA